MRMLFEMDKEDYRECTHTFTRDSARSNIKQEIPDENDLKAAAEFARKVTG